MGSVESSTKLGALLRRVGQGDRAAFTEFYAATAPCACALAEHLLPDPAAHRALVERAYLEVWERASEYKPSSGSPEAWLINLLHRLAVRELREHDDARPAQTDLLRMIYFDGLTYRDIAKRLGVSSETIRARIRENLGLLRAGRV
ncbi:sigma-70 family RNA polymerase sigma factor SigK [Arthrobacter tecti]